MANSIAAALWWGAFVGTLAKRRAVAGTTLLGPWAWSCLALGLLGLAQSGQVFAQQAEPARWIDHAAAAATLCPIIAVFGAKRPQSRFWPFIVASLWVVLMLPAVEAVLAGRSVPDVLGLRVAFHFALIACGLANYIATRNAPPALLCAIAQIGTLARLLGLVDTRYLPALSLGTATCVTAAIAWFHCRPTRQKEQGLNTIWLAFRDAYGAVWALRIAQRMNAMAQKRHWNAGIRWSTIHGNHEFTRCLTMLLRSFVSVEWLQSRQEESVRQTLR